LTLCGGRQLATDHCRIVKGDIPLNRWLRNAAYASRLHPECQKFFQELAEYVTDTFRDDLSSDRFQPARPLLSADRFPVVQKQVHNVVEVLKSLQNSVGDNEVRTTIIQSKAALNSIIETIGKLTTYKGLHENLHRLQLVSKRILRRSARRITKPTDEISMAYLRNYVSQVLTESAGSTALVRQLHRAEDSTTELLWIKQMNAVAKRCEDGLDNLNPGKVSVCIDLLTETIDDQSPRLNNLIFAVTSVLPFSHLAKMLNVIRTNLPHVSVDVERALAAINELTSVLLSRVAAHDRLQLAEHNLSILENRLENPDEIILSEFAALWPETKSTVHAFSAIGTQRGETIIDLKQIEVVDALLLGLEATIDKDSRISKETATVKELDIKFAKFHGNARLQFFQVDRQLKADFDDLIAIDRSLQDLLGRVS
jgi:hypothetical protein